MICLFLALLELVKLQAVGLTQKDAFSEIGLKRLNGFEAAFAGGDTLTAIERSVNDGLTAATSLLLQAIYGCEIWRRTCGFQSLLEQHPGPQSRLAVLRQEGDYVNNSDDPGGATNRGVTQQTYGRYRAAGRLAAAEPGSRRRTRASSGTVERGFRAGDGAAPGLPRRSGPC